jgi:hypothetical protein
LYYLSLNLSKNNNFKLLSWWIQEKKSMSIMKKKVCTGKNRQNIK